MYSVAHHSTCTVDTFVAGSKAVQTHRQNYC